MPDVGIGLRSPIVDVTQQILQRGIDKHVRKLHVWNLLKWKKIEIVVGPSRAFSV